jgi:hypothetical protein
VLAGATMRGSSAGIVWLIVGGFAAAWALVDVVTNARLRPWDGSQ